MPKWKKPWRIRRPTATKSPKKMNFSNASPNWSRQASRNPNPSVMLSSTYPRLRFPILETIHLWLFHVRSLRRKPRLQAMQTQRHKTTRNHFLAVSRRFQNMNLSSINSKNQPFPIPISPTISCSCYHLETSLQIQFINVILKTAISVKKHFPWKYHFPIRSSVSVH